MKELMQDLPQQFIENVSETIVFVCFYRWYYNKTLRGKWKRFFYKTKLKTKVSFSCNEVKMLAEMTVC